MFDTAKKSSFGFLRLQKRHLCSKLSRPYSNLLLLFILFSCYLCKHKKYRMYHGTNKTSFLRDKKTRVKQRILIIPNNFKIVFFSGRAGLSYDTNGTARPAGTSRRAGKTSSKFAFRETEFGILWEGLLGCVPVTELF